MPLPSIGEDLNHRYANAVIGLKRKLEVKTFKVDHVHDRLGDVVFVGYLGEMRRNRWSYDLTEIKISSGQLILNTPPTGYINCYRESPTFATYFERVPARQYRKGINKESHRLYLLEENRELFRVINKLTPSIDATKPRYLYYVYNRRYIPFQIALDLMLSGRALSVALNRRYGLFQMYPYDDPIIQFMGRNIGLFKDNKFLITTSAKECADEIHELTGLNVEVSL